MTISPQTEQRLRQGFRYLNKFMLTLWRLGLGYWLNVCPKVFGRYLVITHTGRKSGLVHHTPVNYAMIGTDLYVTAGFGNASDWYRNLLADPFVEVWLKEGWYDAVAEDVSDVADRLYILRQVIIGSGFVAPLLGLDPYKQDDATFDELTRDYRIIRLRCTAARTGPGGPGELSYIWHLTSLVLLVALVPALFLRRRRK
ncbi:MAG: nitroreductase family deazaflavin-dependent oxidoreductase [Anaerolineae bacterium]|nr:nitroreductase family deazaflavin-dependent oxidoreductase [Anaerolineae bacterium]